MESVPWGAHGHEIAARAAATDLPEAMPAFFRERVAQLEYLNPEPDRWRVDEYGEMGEAFRYDHYVDLENVPESAFDAPDRWRYLRLLYASGLDRPERDAGFLIYRIIELQQRLTTEFRLWRSAPARERRWIEDRIIDDAGVLGHYVTDGSQPHHTTIHFNGWDEDTPNPEGYTLARDFHARFESDFVRANVRFGGLLQRMSGRTPRLGDLRAEVRTYVRTTHTYVEELYRLERDFGFDPSSPADETVEFAVTRLVAGAEMLRSLWWTAWVDSGE